MTDPVMVAEAARSQAHEALIACLGKRCEGAALERFKLCSAVSLHAKPSSRAGRNLRIEEDVRDLQSLLASCETGGHWGEAIEDLIERVRPLVDAEPRHCARVAEEACRAMADLADCLPTCDDWRPILGLIAGRLATVAGRPVF